MILIAAANIGALLFGFWCGRKTARCPKYFWRYLVIGTFATFPLAIGGFTWYDELFAISFLLGCLPVKILQPNRTVYLVFWLFISYMLFQSLRGMINILDFGSAADGIRKIRWPIFFVLIFILFNKANSLAVRKVFDQNLCYKISVFALAFHGIYIVWGVAALIIHGSADYTQYAMGNFQYVYQTTNPFVAIWGSTAYVASMLPVMVVAIFKTIFDTSHQRRVVAWAAFFMIAATEIFYNSRVGGLSLAASLLVAAPRFGFRKIVLLSVSAAVLLVSVNVVFNAEKSMSWYMEDIQRTLRLDDREDKQMQDVERKVWLYSAVPALTDNAYNFLLGYGYRMSGYIVAPHVFELFESYGIKKDFVESVSTEGITNIAVDSGAIGVLLLLVVFSYSAIEILRVGGDWKWVSVFALVQMFGWLFVINNIDVLSFYLVIMPSGILVQLNRQHPAIAK